MEMLDLASTIISSSVTAFAWKEFECKGLTLLPFKENPQASLQGNMMGTK